MPGPYVTGCVGAGYIRPFRSKESGESDFVAMLRARPVRARMLDRGAQGRESRATQMVDPSHVKPDPGSPHPERPERNHGYDGVEGIQDRCPGRLRLRPIPVRLSRPL